MNVDGADVPPPGVGLKIETATTPGVVVFAAAMDAVSVVALTNVVGMAAPFHRTIEVLTKPDPVTVSVNAAWPALRAAGESVWSVGTGAETSNDVTADRPPPGVGLNTVSGIVPGLTRFADGIVAVTMLELTKLVARSAPFHRTIVAGENPPPFNVTVVGGLPAGTVDGVTDAIVAMG